MCRRISSDKISVTSICILSSFLAALFSIRGIVGTTVTFSESSQSTSLIELDASASDPGLLEAAIRADVRYSADHLRHGSRLLEELSQQGKLAVVGAQLDRVSGRVEFFDVSAELATGC